MNRTLLKRARMQTVVILLLLVATVLTPTAVSASQEPGDPFSAPTDLDPVTLSTNHNWPPTNPFDPEFLGRLVGHGPPTGWIYHGSLTLGGCMSINYGASYFYRGSTTVVPTSATSFIEMAGSCSSTAYTGMRTQATVLLNCLGLDGKSNTRSSTGTATSYIVSVAHVDTTSLVCQPGSTLHYFMEARATRANGTFVYYCNRATGLLGGTISESSSSSGPC